MGKNSDATLDERIAARQEELAGHADELVSELTPRAMAERAREDAKLAVKETRADIEATVRDFAAKVQAEARAFAKDPEAALRRPEVRKALVTAAAAIGIIAIVRLTRR